MKLIYVVAAVAMLAMLIPAMAVPVGAADPEIKMYLVDPLNNTGVLGADLLGEDDGYNMSGTVVEIQVTGTTVNSWSKLDNGSTQASKWVPNVADPGAVASVRLTGFDGETDVTAFTADGPFNINKKWATSGYTTPSGSQSIYLTWNESAKKYVGGATVSDYVGGVFVNTIPPQHAVQGTILTWYLFNMDAPLNMSAAEPVDLNARFTALQAEGAGKWLPFFTQIGAFATPKNVKTQTVSDADGLSSISLVANGAETVQIVIVAQFPNDPQFLVTPEYTTVTFKYRQLEVVPQVRWIGEKIVLEKNFGAHAYGGYRAVFTLEDGSVGTLEEVTPAVASGQSGSGQNIVETEVNRDTGLASCILKSSKEGESNVELAVYDEYGRLIENEHSFKVFFLQFAGVKLGNVVGKRDGHDKGLWTPPNPWNPEGYPDPQNPTVLINPDETTDASGHNISADTLLRARVRGYFTNAVRNPARMFAEPVDTDGDGEADLVIPEYAWVLPDDWSNTKLMGVGAKIHWDIMDNPYDNVIALDPYGPFGLASWDATWDNYRIVTTPPMIGRVAAYKVVGPFSPGIELMTPGWTAMAVNPATMANPSPIPEMIRDIGWAVPNPRPDPMRDYQTVVPNGVKDMVETDTYVDMDGNLKKIMMSWDCPMPPAKITYMIMPDAYTNQYGIPGIVNPATIDISKSGFFKWAAKTDIYYKWVYNPMHAEAPRIKVYTNPFYFIMVPAHEWIVAFGNNEHYDWATFGSLDMDRAPQGPYPFWTFINTDEAPLVAAVDGAHPTVASVYSDNHGEAMVWLNGDSNMALKLKEFYGKKGGLDIPKNKLVGETTVRVIADYPYARGAGYYSNKIEKLWLWGSEVLGASNSHTFDDGTATQPSETRMILTAGSYALSPGGVYPYENGTSRDKVLFIWITDRDGKADGVADASVRWSVVSANNAVYIYDMTGFASNYNNVTKALKFTGGVLDGTVGTPAHDVGGHRYYVVTNTKSPASGSPALEPLPALRPDQQPWTADQLDPTKGNWAAKWPMLTAEQVLFYKFFNKSVDAAGRQPNDYRVAAIDIQDTNTTDDATVDVEIHSSEFVTSVSPQGKLEYTFNVYFNPATPDGSYPLDDAVTPGDANMDRMVNMGDVTVIEKMILGLKAPNAQADVNCNGVLDMGDVVKLERALLGLK